eukprot:1784792-Amphidinium_carterae.2
MTLTLTMSLNVEVGPSPKALNSIFAHGVESVLVPDVPRAWSPNVQRGLLPCSKQFLPSNLAKRRGSTSRALPIHLCLPPLGTPRVKSHYADVLYRLCLTRACGRVFITILEVDQVWQHDAQAMLPTSE